MDLRAWQVTGIGNPQAVLAKCEISLPKPKLGEVLVKVQTVSLNFVDVLLAQGKYQANPQLPFTPGLESFGHVAEVGPGCSRTIGQPVIATPYVPGGALADMVLLPERLTYPVPEDMDPVAGAALINSYVTAVLALSRRAQLRAGETVLVHAGAGAVGSAAIRIAKVLGAHVIATAGGPQKLNICRNLGAELVIDYREHDFVDAVRSATGGRGADVIFDPVGGQVFERSRRCIAPEGRILVIGFASGDIPSVPINHPLLKLYSVVGSAVGIYREKMPDVWFDAVNQVLDLYRSGIINPLIHSVISFDHVPAGYRLIMERSSWGKVVVAVGLQGNMASAVGQKKLGTLATG
jgi:NADPH2:quinone reductase